MKKILVCLLASISIATFAQKKWSGKVIDKATKEPISEATIFLAASNTTIQTDGYGQFRLSTNDEKIKVSHIGFASLQLDTVYNNMVIELEKGKLNLTEVVVQANKTGNPFSTIGKVDMLQHPIQSSQDVLRLVPGLFIGQHQAGGKAEQIFLRGFDIDHGTDVQLRVDGMPVNLVSHAHGQGYADLHFLIPELIDKVDYGKGPYSTQHGNFSTAGYVDFKTKKVLSNNLYKVEAGQFNSIRLVALTDLLSDAQKRKGTSAYIATEFSYNDGPFDSPIHFNRINIAGRYNTNLSEATALSFSGAFFNSRWDASGQIPNRSVLDKSIGRFGAIDNTEGGNTGRINANLQLTTKMNESTVVENNLYYINYHFNLHSNFTFFLNNPVDGDQIRQRERRDIFGYNGSWTKSKDNGINSQSFKAGYGFRLDKTKDSELSSTKNRTEVLDYIQLGDINELNVFAFAEKRFSTKKWLLSAGARLDYFAGEYSDQLTDDKLSKSRNPIFSPKLSVQYFANANTELYLKLGKSFHTNDTRELLEANPSNNIPSAYGLDAGITFKPIPSLVVNAAAWYLYLEQEFVYVGDEGIVEPSGKTRRYGLDLSLRYQHNQWLLADLNINAANPRSIEAPANSNYIPLAPTFTSTGGIAATLGKSTTVALRYRFMGNRAANEDKSVIADGYFVTDMNITYSKKKYEFGLIIENLFNTQWKETQFNTQSQLRNEPNPVEEIHFTPGVPFFVRFKFAVML
jgi:hypothetical protein